MRSLLIVIVTVAASTGLLASLPEDAHAACQFKGKGVTCNPGGAGKKKGQMKGHMKGHLKGPGQGQRMMRHKAHRP